MTARSERTPYAGLLALLEASQTTQGWGNPYWNPYFLDGLLYGLAMAPRTGAIPLLAPTGAPTLALLGTGGVVPAGQTLEIAQTFVDAYGRETDASPVGTISTGAGLADPAMAPTLGAPSAEASGYGGGLLEVTYTWLDENGGETLAAPAANVQLPYLALGLYSQVEVTLPSTPAAAGAAGANVYVCFNGGNVVLAKAIIDDSLDHVTLDGTTESCYRTPPWVSTVGATGSIQITGEAGPAGAVLTRFYVRPTGEEWTADDRRLSIAGVTEWDVATVAYPLVYTGAPLAAGYPPPYSLVKAIRKTDLASEVDGILPKENMEAAGVQVRLVGFDGGLPDWDAALAEPGSTHGEFVLLVVDGVSEQPYPALLYWWDTNVEPDAWRLFNPLLPTTDMLHSGGARKAGTMNLQETSEALGYELSVHHTDDPNDDESLPLRLWYRAGMGDYLGFFGCYDDLATLQDEEYEPWNSGYILAYVIDTDSWYSYVPQTQAVSDSGVNPATDLSGGTDNKFNINVDGAGAVEIALTLADCTNYTEISNEIMRACRAAGIRVTVYYLTDHYSIRGDSRDGASVVITDAAANNCADDLKLGIANGGSETPGAGGWVKNPSSAMRGTFANIAGLPAAADEGDSAFVLDQGDGVPGLMRYESSSWVEKGKMTAP